ncbi:MAG: PDZ domain-containing protein [Planctomycetia bacterium]|nr:PDZ domain-containing protein [Planctomycetia bacterium]
MKTGRLQGVWGWLGCVAAILISGPMLSAQEPPEGALEIPLKLELQGFPDEAHELFVAAQPSVRNFWVGLITDPADETLRAQLGIEEGGLVVREPVKDGPAAKAGIETHDVLVLVGDKPMKEVGDLIQVIDKSEGKELKFVIVRKGQKMNIAVVPAKPPGNVAGVRAAPFANKEALHKWIQQFHGQALPGLPAVPGGAQPFGFKVVQPGVVAGFAGAAAKLPDNVTITITRKGSEKATITVQKGESTYKVTEDKVGDLPEDVREHVKRMLGTAGVSLVTKYHALAQGAPGAHAAHALGGAVRLPDATGDSAELKKELQELKKQLEELRKAVEELKEKK